MIRTTITKLDDEYVVEIPAKVMEELGLQEGDLIEFQPKKVEPRGVLRPEIEEALERSWEQNEAGYRYLADR